MDKMYVLNGPDTGQFFHVGMGFSYLGRGPDNNIEITDKTVSRRHLKLLRMGDRLYIADMKSRNGTFYDGEYLIPGVEVEVKERAAIAIGITVICFGEGCIDEMLPFKEMRDSVKIVSELKVERRKGSDEKKEALLQNVCDVLVRGLPIRDAAEEILGFIFELLGRIDRAAFILIDVRTKGLKDIFFKTRKPADDENNIFSRGVLNRVVERMKPLVVLDARMEEDTELADTLKVLKIESVMCVPLFLNSNVIGALYVDSLRRPCGFRREDLHLFLDLSQRIAMAIEEKNDARESGR